MSADTTKPYPDRGDWGWLACDREGHLALFITGGEGPVPMQALDPSYPEDVEDRLIDLPAMSDVNRVTSWPDAEVPERGVFLYDWNDRDNTYELVLAPYRPCALDQLPADLAEVARSIRFTQLSFAEAWRIDARTHMSCQERSR